MTRAKKPAKTSAPKDQWIVRSLVGDEIARCDKQEDAEQVVADRLAAGRDDAMIVHPTSWAPPAKEMTHAEFWDIAFGVNPQTPYTFGSKGWSRG